MNELQKKFKDSLTAKKLPISESKKIFEELKSSNSFDLLEIENIVKSNNHWNESYFFEQIAILSKSGQFTEQQCLHLIEIKEYLQEYGMDGFSSNQSSIEDVNEVSQSDSSIPEFDKNLLDQFQVEHRLEEVILEENIDIIKIKLMDYIMQDYYSVNDALFSILYCYDKKPELFEEYTESKMIIPIDENRDHWNLDYLTRQQVALNNNLSFKRLFHMVEVAAHIDADNSNKSKISRLIKQPKIESDYNRDNSTQAQHEKNRDYIQEEGNILERFIKLFCDIIKSLMNRGK